MRFDEDQWHSLMEASPGNALWWVEIAALLDNLKTSALTELYLGDVPAEHRRQAAELDIKASAFMQRLCQTRLLVGEWAGDDLGTETVSEAVSAVWKEWRRLQRNVSDFLAEVHWRDLGVAG